MDTNNTEVTQEKTDIIQEFGSTLVQAIIAFVALIGAGKAAYGLLE